jgi:lysophospholipase L1-like esterase
VRQRISRLLAFALSLVLTFLFAEMGLRFLSSHWLYVFDVEMWRYARLVKVESTVPHVVEEHRPKTDVVLMGVRVRTDEHAFRLPDPETEARRRPDDRVVVALGDSVTFGWGAPDGETYPAFLERILNERCARRSTVHNAGIGNCNSTMEVARYERYIRPLHPDWVILGFSYNDAEPEVVPSKNPFLWRSALLALASARFQRLSGPYSNYETYYKGLYRDGLPGWEKAQQAIRALGASLRADGIPGTVALLPELHHPYRFGAFAEIFARVGEIARESGFEVIDPSGTFPQGSGETFWVSRDDPHPNGRAQILYAQALARSRFACANGPAPQRPTTSPRIASARASAAQR